MSDYRFRIVAQDESGARVAAEFFHVSALKKDGTLEWKVGPMWYDLPLDAAGLPIQEQALLQFLSNVCPTQALDREVARRSNAAEPRKISHKAMMNTVHTVVRKQGPTVLPGPKGDDPTFELVSVVQG